MDGDLGRLTGPRKAAALLITLGAERAAAILKGMREDEIEAITREIVKIERLPAAVRDKILAQVHEETAARQPDTTGGTDFARDLLARSMPSQKAAELLAKASEQRRERPFDFLTNMDSAQVAQILATEHPQTVALVLSHLAHDVAGRILIALPGEVRADVTTRLAVMAPMDPQMVRSVESVLRQRFAALEQQGLRKAGGLDHVVAMLGTLDSRSERAILEELADRDPTLADQIRQNMFVFEDLRLLDDRSIRRLLQDVRRELPLALRTASDDLKNRVFSNMSARARQELQDEIVIRGPARVRDIEEAQQRIVDVAKELAEREEILISRGREDVFI